MRIDSCRTRYTKTNDLRDARHNEYVVHRKWGAERTAPSLRESKPHERRIVDRQNVDRGLKHRSFVAPLWARGLKWNEAC